MVNNLDLGESVYNKYVGTLQIHEIHDDGNVIIRKAPNIITYDAREILAYLLAGDNLVDRYVKYLQVGDDVTAPTRNDTTLANSVDTVGVTYTFPLVDRVQFEAILPNVTPANGSTLREAGLFNNSGKMFSRQVHGDIAKTSAIQLKYIWTIIFT